MWLRKEEHSLAQQVFSHHWVVSFSYHGREKLFKFWEPDILDNLPCVKKKVADNMKMLQREN